MNKSKRDRVAVVSTVDRDQDFTPEARRVYARQVNTNADHSYLFAIEAGTNRPDVLLFGGHVDPTAAERKIRIKWPENPQGRGVESLNIDGVYVTLAQLETLAESLASIVAELRKWEAR